MRKSLLLAAVLGAFSVPAAVMAEEAAAPASPYTVSYNVGLYSQYIFRGLTQTGREPALQGGIDLSHESGFYAGSWGSNVSWVKDGGYKKDSSLEWDIYGGYKAEIGDTGITYDVGALQYIYPGDTAKGLNQNGFADPNTTEVYGALGWNGLTFKDSYVVSTDAFGIENGRGSNYADLSYVYAIGDSGYSLLAHVGYQYFDGKTTVSGGASADNDKLYSYTDWKFGVNKAWDNGVNVGGYYTGTDAGADGWKNPGTNNRNLGRDAVTFYVQKTF
ncbi:hypothetical protein A7981_01190 [Methylovorus sp. MM2]|uniref:TorF family putative porin n=1 Tax=Methylovorus sp. MM2 TaxID=1848038 RepID=UPI0007E23277|nr:TorF family putative porin [Methylovorus sp. MM2]OAM52134.1 hypothetical protein A7981_01190 [Methylovorus sp. MM2]